NEQTAVRPMQPRFGAVDLHYLVVLDVERVHVVVVRADSRADLLALGLGHFPHRGGPTGAHAARVLLGAVIHDLRHRVEHRAIAPTWSRSGTSTTRNRC